MTEPSLWRAGMLGRFEVEDSKRPRFEVLGKNPKRGVAVWYGGNEKPVFVPEDVFKSRCVPHWEIEVVPPLEPWIKKDAVFSLSDPRAARLTQAVVKSGYNQQISQVDVLNHDLQLRAIQYDYASCFDRQTKILVMVPLKRIVQFGLQVQTRLDRLLGEDPLGDDPDEVDDLLKDL